MGLAERAESAMPLAAAPAWAVPPAFYEYPQRAFDAAASRQGGSSVRARCRRPRTAGAAIRGCVRLQLRRRRAAPAD